jgi:hypothetical protein
MISPWARMFVRIVSRVSLRFYLYGAAAADTAARAEPLLREWLEGVFSDD